MSGPIGLLVQCGTILIPVYVLALFARWRLERLIEASSLVAQNQLTNGGRTDWQAWHEAALLSRHGRQLWTFAVLIYLILLAWFDGSGLLPWIAQVLTHRVPGARPGS
jgi:hypothetical protein